MAQSGNGIDIGAVYRLLTDVSNRLDSHERRFDQLFGVINELFGVTNEQGRKLDDLAVGLTDLRATVTNYHGAVLGHGVLISELDERLRRVERHLKLEPSSD